MDIDPPPPPSSSSGPSKKKAVKKLKFTPKPPSRRKLVLPKRKLNRGEFSGKANVNSALALSLYYPYYIGWGLETAAEDVIAPHGAGSSSTTDELKDKKNSSNLGYAPEKMVTRSSSIVAKDEVTETMLVDAESGYSSNSDNEYKEPWVRYGSINYDSYYPITLPLRPPCSVNPEVLDAQEFGEEKEYVETKMNTASK
ncbi:RNA polymerase III RPC4, partial [Tanacetum coccineum]